MLGVLVQCGPLFLRAVWFNMPFMAEKFRQGQEVLLSGKPRRKGQRWEMAHPRVQWIDAEEGEEAKGELLPVYALTEGLKQGGLRHISRQAIDAYADLVEERFAETYLAEHRLMPIGDGAARDSFPHQPRELAVGAAAVHLSGDADPAVGDGAEAKFARDARPSAAAGGDGADRCSHHAAIAVRIDRRRSERRSTKLPPTWHGPRR